MKYYYIIMVFLLFSLSTAHSQEKYAENWTRELHVKTNVVGLGLGIANAAVEVDLAKHWSFTLPIYYSAWDYFQSTIKFRTLAVQPEVRYWFKSCNEGWFIGGHYGLGYYNLALNGDYRYQDHDQKTPSMGGGISAGYRTHLSKNKRWKMEFALGGGVYDAHYDTYYNVENGKQVDTYGKTYIGVDNVSVNISYCFNLNKRKK